MRKLFFIFLIVLSSFVLTSFAPPQAHWSAAAQQAPALTLPSNVPAPATPSVATVVQTDGRAVAQTQGAGDPLFYTAKTPYEFYIIQMIVGFAAFVMVVLLVVFWRVPAFNEELFMRTFTITLIVLAAVFLIVAGFSSQQVAPAFGLLGTIAGYIMGKLDAGKTSNTPPPPPNEPPAPPAPPSAGVKANS